MFSWATSVTSRAHKPDGLDGVDRRKSALLVTASQEDVIDLGLPPEKVRVLKKTLFYFSRLFSEVGDHDIFATSWDVRNVPKPPDNILAVLPPRSWDEPDLIIIGLQNAVAEFIDDWSSVCHESVKEYSVDFLPILPTEKPLMEGGVALFVFVRRQLASHIQQLSTQTVLSSFPAIACSFVIHQAPLCIVNTDLGSYDSPSGNVTGGHGTQKCEVETMSAKTGGFDVYRDALIHQQFKTLVDRLQFDAGGKLRRLADFPTVMFLGCKDLQPAGALHIPIMRRLNHLDVRFCPIITSGRKYRGTMDVVKAGIMRLMMEVEGGGSRTACPEVTMLRMGIPSVDATRLRRLYQSVWWSLKKGDELVAVDISPKIVEIATIRPFIPHTFKFTLRNPNTTPAAFSVLCLANSGRSLVPLGYHSLLHREKLGHTSVPSPPIGQATTKRQQTVVVVNVDEEPVRSRTSSKLDTSRVPSTFRGLTTAASIANDLQKKFFSLKRKADKNFQSMLTRRSSTASQQILPSASAMEEERTGDYLAPPVESGDSPKSAALLSVATQRNSERTGSKRWWGKLGWGASGQTKHHQRMSKYMTEQASSLPFESTDHRTIVEGRSSNGSQPCSLETSVIEEGRPSNDGVALTRREGDQVPSRQNSADECSVTESNFEVDGSPHRTASVGVRSQDSVDASGFDDRGWHTVRARMSPTASESGQVESKFDLLHETSPGQARTPVSLPELKLPLQGKENGAPSPLATTQKFFDLAKWLLIEPCEGVILANNEIEVMVTICVKEAVLKEIDIPDLVLAVRLDNCKFDTFFSIQTRLTPSISGMTVQQLQGLEYVPARLKSDAPPLVVPVESFIKEDVIPRSQRNLPMPKELWWLLVTIYERTTLPEQRDKADNKDPNSRRDPARPSQSTQSVAECGIAERESTRDSNIGAAQKLVASPRSLSSAAPTTSSTQHGTPSGPITPEGSPPSSPSNEFVAHPSEAQSGSADEFRFVEFLVQSAAGFSKLGTELKSQVKTVQSSIESGMKIPDAVGVCAVLLVFEKWAFESHAPVIPRECLTDLNNDPSHLLCRAVLLSLPMCTRNLLVAFLSLIRHLIHREVTMFPSNDPNSDNHLKVAIVEWLSRVLLRDSPTDLAVAFVSHFVFDHAVVFAS